MKTGVYTITNTINNKIYVGSALISINKRFSQHKSDLKKGKHVNKYLQSSWDKYGEENFKFEVLEYYPPEICLDMEKYWINILNSKNSNFGYNINDPINSRLGVLHTEESKLKMRYAQLGEKSHMFGKKLTSEHVEILRKNRLGKKASNETRQKMSEQRKGKNTKEDNPFYGKNHSEETVEKLRQITKDRWKNKPHPNLGKKASEELKLKLSNAHKGKPSPNKKKVYQYTLEKVFIREWESAKEAAEFLNKTSNTPIQACCKGRTKKAFGFIWSYEKLN